MIVITPNTLEKSWFHLDQKEVDRPCRVLCEVLNFLPGIETTGSCAGHGKKPYCIWFEAERIDLLGPILEVADGREPTLPDWKIYIMGGRGCITFYLEGPKGKQAYREADRIAMLIMERMR